MSIESLRNAISEDAVARVIQEQVRAVIGAEKSYGLFIKLPSKIADQFPKKKEDSSPPHITLLYIGSGPDDEKGAGIDVAKMIDVLRTEISEMEPFEAIFDGVGYFKTVNKEDGNICDRVVSHVKVRFEPEKRQWKGYLWTVLEKAGIDIIDSFPNFSPHCTLSFDYDQPHSFKYEGHVPSGKFMVEEIELWDGNEVTRFKVGP